MGCTSNGGVAYMKIFFLFLAILFVVFPVSAIDCDMIDNRELCLEINNMDLSEEEKEYLISDIIDDSKNYPNHDFVKEWNLNLDTFRAPVDIQKHNSVYIKNAWVKLLTVMPSVLEGNTLYHSDNSEVLSAFNHEVEIPDERIDGDCKTKYYLEENREELNLYVNDDYAGSGRLISFVADKDSEFKVEYDVFVKIKIKHYEWDSYCCKRDDDGRCIKTCRECEYDHTEYKTDNLRINDEVNLKYYDIDSEADFSVKEKYFDTTKGVLSGKDFSSLHLKFSNSYFSDFNYVYSRVWDSYNVLTVKAEKKKRTEHNNLFYSGNYDIEVKDTTNCKVLVYDHFNKKIIPCDLNFEELGIEIKTDKLVYSQDEIIKVNLKPEDVIFEVNYANETYSAKENLELDAVYPYNKISIIHNGKSYEKIIHIKNEESMNFLFFLTIFGGFNYIFANFVKKYWGKCV